MSQVQKHASNAERQRAYRQRRAQEEATKATEAKLVPLPAISSVPGTIRWRASLDRALLHAATVRDEMQAYHDQRTERWQESDKAAEFLERLDQIQEIVDQLEAIRNEL